MGAARLLDEPASAPSEPQANDEVDVLEIGEEPLVEAPDRQEGLTCDAAAAAEGPTGSAAGPSSTSSGSPFR